MACGQFLSADRGQFKTVHRVERKMGGKKYKEELGKFLMKVNLYLQMLIPGSSDSLI